jgi:hypothetical protein
LLDPTETDLRALMTNTHLHTQLKDTPAKVQHGMASMMHHATVAAPVLRRNVALAAIDLHRTAAERMAVSGLSSSSDLVPPKHRSAIQVSDQTPQTAQTQLGDGLAVFILSCLVLLTRLPLRFPCFPADRDRRS